MNRQTLEVHDCWYLTGPTASGKSAVGLELSRRLNAEIISLDSMAVYRGMDIGTAKVTRAEQARVPHHLLDIVDPSEEYSLAQYVAAAHEAVAGVAERGRAALFVGGTPLYLKSLLRGIFVGPPSDWELRRELRAIAEHEGSEALHAQLANVDAVSAERLHPRDTRRVIRALEVWRKTGQSITALQQQFDRARPAEACRVFVLDLPRGELVQRIDARVDAMFAAGLVDEVRGLLARFGTLGRTASQAVGYREVGEHLQGRAELAETVARVKLRTRQFAKRQMTWFRSLSECQFVGCSSAADPGEIAGEVFSLAGPPR